MLALKTEKLEVRGLINKTSKNGNVYYILHTETEDGEPCAFFVRDSSVFPEGMKKGDKVSLSLVYNRFKELEVVSVVKAGA